MEGRAAKESFTMGFDNKETLPIGAPPISRRTANYPPSIWDDCFIQSLPDTSLSVAQLESWELLKEEIRQLILDKSTDTLKLLELIDVLCQLGVSYHFSNEIKDKLSYISSSLDNSDSKLEGGLYAFALLFRLLREHGIKDKNISANILLTLFKSESESSTNDIKGDVKGMLSLYEASYLIVEGEEELDEARNIILTHLRKYLKEPFLIDCHMVKQIEYAIELPLHWRSPRQHTRWFIDFYEMQNNINTKLLQFVKLDFNMVQSLHKKELKNISGWWENLGLSGYEFNFARNRLVEVYFWSVGCTFEPEFSRYRKIFTKFSCFITTIDDIYDVYGFIEELKIFTKAINDWELITQLPKYMKLVLKAFFDTVQDVSSEILLEKGLDVLPHLKRVWRDQGKTYLVEAMWYYSGYTPTLNEYIENAWVTIGAPMLLISAYCANEHLTKEILDKIEFYSDVIRYSSILNRLYDDLGTSTDELQRGDIPKAIQCHMMEGNVSESIARNHISNLIKMYWKLMNGEHVGDSRFEESYKKCWLNLPRITQLIYLHGDGFAKSQHRIKDMIISLLIDPLPL